MGARQRHQELLERGGLLRARAQDVVAGEQRLREDVTRAFTVLRAGMVQRELDTIPVARLRDVTGGRLRLGTLEKSGFATVRAVFNARPADLATIPGVSRETATQAVAAARQIAQAVEHDLRIRIDLDPQNKTSTALLVSLHRLRQAVPELAPVREDAGRLAQELSNLVATAGPARGWFRMLFTGDERRTRMLYALDRIAEITAEAGGQGVASGLGRAVEAARRPPAEATEVWKDFERNSPEYYGLLGEIVDLHLDVEGAEGFLPAEIIARIREQRLDDAFRRVSLRGYQEFGAKFALVQRRVIIGDEMGLGKTIQAIAVMAHLRALDRTHFLVVCPTSVLLNWLREINSRSRLRTYSLHGPDRTANLRRWRHAGGVAVTTFGTLRSLEPGELKVALLVVDEAHMVKNPATQRSQATADWTEVSERVLFLTGTPLENRVEEFGNLVGYLRPNLAEKVNGREAVLGPTAFRRTVAPVYLRRNIDDVLGELPDLVRTDEWVEFASEDADAYFEAVRAGNFMAMRRAAYQTSTPKKSAKVRRLLEIVGEAAENGRKVVIFSYFRDVLETVRRAIGGKALGPLTGSTPPVQRLALVDQLSRVDGHAVLLSQIEAGGVGMNMQAASVVILCEPQIKPTIEEQAIARLHRMGQVRSVQVHRLLVADSVDQRMLEMLGRKTRLFDEYARPSDIAEAAPDALDISEVELARRIVAEEQERLVKRLMADHAARSPA
ncbi:MAG TPA: DEAD/DEAH box helicase [Mycobacteriales bacterium]